MTVNEAVRDLLGAAREGVALDTLYAEAQRKGISIGRNTIATARRGEIGKPKPETITALAVVFGVDPKNLREAIGLPQQHRRWTPPEEAHSLTLEVQDALTVLIKRIVNEGGSDAGTTREKSPGPGEPGKPKTLQDYKRERLEREALPIERAANTDEGHAGNNPVTKQPQMRDNGEGE